VVSSPGTTLRRNRIKIALWIAAIEGLLALVGVIPRWAVFVFAAIAVAFWAFAGRNYRNYTGRHLSWIFAVSQAAAVLVPVVWYLAKWVAIIAIVGIAAGALIFLFMERDRSDDRPAPAEVPGPTPDNQPGT
jgi:hypothetical protein